MSDTIQAPNPSFTPIDELGMGPSALLRAFKREADFGGIIVDDTAYEWIAKTLGESYVDEDERTVVTIDDYPSTTGIQIVGGIALNSIETNIVDAATFREQHGSAAEHSNIWLNTPFKREELSNPAGRLILNKNEILCVEFFDAKRTQLPAGYILPHRLNEINLSNGRPITDILHLHLNRFRRSPARGCIVQCDHGCDIPFAEEGTEREDGQVVSINKRGRVTPRNYYGIKSASLMEEALSLAIEAVAKRDGITIERVKELYNIIDSGGIPAPSDYAEMQERWLMLPRYFHDPEIMMSPVSSRQYGDLIDLEMLVNAGIGGFYFNPDVVGPDVALNREKHQRISYEIVMDYVERAVDLMRRTHGEVNGRVKVMFMIGPYVDEDNVIPSEYFKELFRWMEGAMSRGADIILSPFEPPNVGPSKDSRRPYPWEVKYVMSYGLYLMHKYRHLKVAVGQRNAPSSHNITEFGWNAF